jgi:hypothetical protein
LYDKYAERQPRNQLLHQIFCRTILDMKRTRGRPAKTPAERKGERVEVRADSLEKRQFEKAAAKAGIKLSDWIRTRLNAAARRELSLPNGDASSGQKVDAKGDRR